MAIPSPGSATNTLAGVAVVSPRLAWAVGGYSNLGPGGGTLIERWDGTAWTHVPSPSPGGPYSGPDSLSAVAASSPVNAWAVGWAGAGGPGSKTLIEHWDGTAWTHVPSPNPGVVYYGNILDAVAVTSPSNAWTVGQYYNTSDNPKTLILHWDGTAWTRVPSPSPKGFDPKLYGVAATSPSNAWAVGSIGYQPLILHWDGTTWTRAATPDVGGFTGVAASSPSNAWAVGDYWDGTQDRTLTLHWNGTAWTRIPSPSVAHANNIVEGVTTTSPTSAWAVGWYTNGTTHARTLVLHWNGTAWSRVKSPNVPQPSINALSAVSASSATNAWAVGLYAATTATEQVVALHCC